MTTPAIPATAPPPLPDGLADCLVRQPGAADVDLLFELSAAADRAVIGTVLGTRAEVAHGVTSELARREVRQLLVERAGRIVGWAWLQRVAADHFAGDLQIDPELSDPDSDALAGWALAWYDAIGRDALTGDVERVQLGNWCYQQSAARSRQFERGGYTNSRVFMQMTKDLSAAEQFPAAPPGIVVRPAEVDPADPAGGEAAVAHRLVTAAFADHYNFSPSTFELWWSRRVDDAGFDPSLWFLAEVDGVPLGVIVMCRELEAEQNAGFVQYVGVVREARGRGIAKALLYKGFEVNRDQGRSTVKLFVDAASPTGATRLYESAGMRTTQTILDWQRWLPR